jgi:hypothetical protein
MTVVHATNGDAPEEYVLQVKFACMNNFETKFLHAAVLNLSQKSTRRCAKPDEKKFFYSGEDDHGHGQEEP